MSRLLLAATAALLIIACGAPATADDTAAALRNLVESSSHPELSWSDLGDVHSELEHVYDATAYTPVWMRNGQPSPQAHDVVRYLRESYTRGLQPADYDVAVLETFFARPSLTAGDTQTVARFDTALTVALLRLLHHTENGRIDPRRMGFGLEQEPEPLDLHPALLDIAGSTDVTHEIDRFEPPFPLFRRLLTALAAYRTLALRDDLPEIPEIPTLHPGETSTASPALRARLRTLGDLPPDAKPPTDPALYDEPLVAAVNTFQRRHGLEVDGVIGRATLAALQVPLSERVAQIELAIERLRWLPRRTPERFLIVNIPEFRLVAFERGQRGPVLTSSVVVGSAARRNETPILTAEMEYVVFRPYWNIPPGILRKEILPKVGADPGYLARNNMERVDGRIRQRPGPNNSLGLVKFIFPNRFHVYLHDTPAKALFSRARRDFSHGCIRVAKPIELAEFVLKGQGDWTRDRIVDAMQRERDNRHVRLDQPVAVYLLYSTVIVSSEGEVRFFADVYGHDVELRKALAKGPPYS